MIAFAFVALLVGLALGWWLGYGRGCASGPGSDPFTGAKAAALDLAGAIYCKSRS